MAVVVLSQIGTQLSKMIRHHTEKITTYIACGDVVGARWHSTLLQNLLIENGLLVADTNAMRDNGHQTKTSG